MDRKTAIIVTVVVVGASLLGIFLVGDVADVEAGGNASDPDAQDSSPDGADGNASEEVAQDSGLNFRAVDQEVGFNYTGVEWRSGSQTVISDSGLYATDYDHDGWTDVLALGGERPILFQNAAGEFHPSDSLPPLDRDVRAALFFDYDNDGWQDLLVLPHGQEPLLLENREGEFAVREGAFEGTLSVPIGATAGDYDGDGCPDLFVIQNGDWTEHDPAGLTNFTVPEDNGNTNRLYRGDCGGEFEDVTNQSGIRGAHWTLAATTANFNDDGHQDIYVATDWNRDVFYLNRGNGTFERRLMSNRTNRNAMAAEVGDVNGDQRPDVFVTNIELPEELNETLTPTLDRRYEGHNLQINRGNGTFRDAAPEYGVRVSGWGWASSLADLDNDMDDDLVHTTYWIEFNPHTSPLDPEEIRLLYQNYPNLKYAGLYERSEAGFEWRSPSNAGMLPTDGRGLATLDFDRDGRLDIANSNVSGPYRLHENAVETSNRSVQIGVRSGQETTALGARVHVTAGNETQIGYRNAKSDFLSQDSQVLHFGTGNDTRADVQVVWPDGTEQTFENLSTNARYVITPEGITESYQMRATG